MLDRKLGYAVEGNRLEYRFDPDDPIVKQIIDRAKAKPAKKGGELDELTRELQVAYNLA